MESKTMERKRIAWNTFTVKNAEAANEISKILDWQKKEGIINSYTNQPKSIQNNDGDWETQYQININI